MARRDPRVCPWLHEPRGTVVTVTPAAWWLAITRNPLTVRFRTNRSGGLVVLCRAKKRSDY